MAGEIVAGELYVVAGGCWGLQQCPVWSVISSFPPLPLLPSGFLPLARFPWRWALNTWARSRECAQGRCALSSGWHGAHVEEQMCRSRRCARSRCAQTG